MVMYPAKLVEDMKLAPSARRSDRYLLINYCQKSLALDVADVEAAAYANGLSRTETIDACWTELRRGRVVTRRGVPWRLVIEDLSRRKRLRDVLLPIFAVLSILIFMIGVVTLSDAIIAAVQNVRG